MGTEKAGETMAEVWQKGFYAGVNAVRKFANTPNPYSEPAESSPPEFNALEASRPTEEDMEVGLELAHETPGCLIETQGDCNFAARLAERERQLREALAENQSLKDKLSVELQALADKDKNEVFYLQRIADLDSQLEQLKAGYKELEAEVAKLNGLLVACQASAEKIAQQRDGMGER